MIALDTNVIVRLIVRDDLSQQSVSEHILEQARQEEEQVHISDIVSCELVWNLDQGYGFKKNRII